MQDILNVKMAKLRGHCMMWEKETVMVYAVRSSSWNLLCSWKYQSRGYSRVI